MWIEVNLHSCVKCGFYWADFRGIRSHWVNSCGELLQRILARSYKKMCQIRGVFFLLLLRLSLGRLSQTHVYWTNFCKWLLYGTSRKLENMLEAGTRSQADNRTWSPHRVLFLYEYRRPAKHATPPGWPLNQQAVNIIGTWKSRVPQL